MASLASAHAVIVGLGIESAHPKTVGVGWLLLYSVPPLKSGIVHMEISFFLFTALTLHPVSSSILLSAEDFVKPHSSVSLGAEV